MAMSNPRAHNLQPAMVLENLLTATPPAPEDCFDHGDEVHPKTAEHLQMLYDAAEALKVNAATYTVGAEAYVLLALARGLLVCESVETLKIDPQCAAIRSNLVQHLFKCDAAVVPPCLHFEAVQKMLNRVDRESKADVTRIRILANLHGRGLVQACRENGCSDAGEELVNLLLDFGTGVVQHLVAAYPQWALQMRVVQNQRLTREDMAAIARALTTVRGVDRRDVVTKLLERAFLENSNHLFLGQTIQTLDAIADEDNRAFAGDAKPVLLKVEVSEEDLPCAQLDDALSQLCASMPESDGRKPALTLAHAAADAAAFSSPSRTSARNTPVVAARLSAGKEHHKVVRTSKLHDALARMSPGVLPLVPFGEEDGYDCNSDDDSPHKGRSRKHKLTDVPQCPVSCEDEASLHSSAPPMVTPPRMRRQRSGAVGGEEALETEVVADATRVADATSQSV